MAAGDINPGTYCTRFSTFLMSLSFWFDLLSVVPYWAEKMMKGNAFEDQPRA